MSGWNAKRFWTKASVVEATGGFTVALDERPIKTPAKSALVVPTRTLAGLIAAEWEAQGDVVRPDTMPCTRMANSVIDKVIPQRSEVAEMLAAYGDSDLLCYRAEGPEGLVARQSQAWDAALDWAETALGARLQVRTGVIHTPQDDRTLQILSARVHALDPFVLAPFHDLVALSGSLVLAFAVLGAWRSPEDIWEMSRIDELWQEENWGRDDEASETAAQKRAAFLSAKAFLDAATAPDR